MYNNGCKPAIGNYYINDTNHSQEHYYFSSFLPNYTALEDHEAVLCEQQHMFSNDNYYHNSSINILDHEMTTNIMAECGSGQVPRKSRQSKGDRHSKIETARGPRDRRMRLSLEVAKKLFGLQDLLGFDKASKTVDWLLKKSNTAILELLPDHRSCSFLGVSNSATSTSECEVLSGTGGDDDQSTTKNKAKCKKQTTSAGLHHPLAKATRERARARARERTIEKRNYKLQDSRTRSSCHQLAMDEEDVNRLAYWSPFERQGFVGDNSSVMMTGGNWSPSYLFNYQHEHHQFNDFQVIGKSMEEGNNT